MSLIAEFLKRRDVKDRPRARLGIAVAVLNGILWTASFGIIILMSHFACIYDNFNA